jgi:tetratricopeptide (TPR) repeat protein
MKVLYNKPVAIKQPVHKAIETIIATKGVVKAVEEYQKMKKDTAKYYIDWISMDFLGNQLFTLKRYEDARILFENNATEFPDKDLVVISLAKIYQELGRKEDAIKLYKKAISLGTVNQEAKNRLKELEAKN